MATRREVAPLLSWPGVSLPSSHISETTAKSDTCPMAGKVPASSWPGVGTDRAHGLHSGLVVWSLSHRLWRFVQVWLGAARLPISVVVRPVAVNRDRGAPHDAAPPTPPGIRVRTTAVRRIKRPPASPWKTIQDL